jgi:hypothetical protein
MAFKLAVRIAAAFCPSRSEPGGRRRFSDRTRRDRPASNGDAVATSGIYGWRCDSSNEMIESG